MRQTFLHGRQPRVDCPDHGVKTVEVPWARPQVGFTLLMEAFILALVQNGMTPNQVSRMIGEHDTRMWRVVEHDVDEARARFGGDGHRRRRDVSTKRPQLHHGGHGLR